MRILLIGSGGREHAIAWKLHQSPQLEKLYIAPGNPGTEQLGTNLQLNPLDFEAVAGAVREHEIGMVVVGPEEPLVRGIRDHFANHPDLKDILFIGPAQAGAMLEGSKDFAKDFMQRHGIPTAAYASFDKSQLEDATAYLDQVQPPYVIKADGLAAGKGVLICEEKASAQQALQDMMVDSKFGTAGDKVVIEAFLEGIELSVFVLTDGTSYRILPSAKDYKRIGEGDTGLNTGGMGAVSPVPFATVAFLNKVEERVVIPTIRGLQLDKIPYTGFIFIGLMNVNGDPFVIEYNVRMGDPETEVVMPRLECDLVELLTACARGELAGANLQISNDTVVTVVMVSGGYPEAYEKNIPVRGIDKPSESLIFQAGTGRDEGGRIVTKGGRVLAVTSRGTNITQALTRSYRTIGQIAFDKMYFRKDIGFDLVEATEKAGN
ncbi:MAG: phosphoribosylamine--glycine ligase [Flavobacteriales bacterium]|nr:phosphoribosylamine--glycine ligase [Flavobacteriales bacterium]MCB9449394.1 phosphoribosylamine--glycine ligase [Flavobacteriales bacterium]